MPALSIDTIFKSTLGKIVSGALALTVLVWQGRGAISNYQRAMDSRFDKIDARLTSIEAFMRNEAVTQSQAERYAAAFRWENRELRIVVPKPEDYQDKPKS